MAMSKLDTIIAREYLERVRSKWFLVATVLGPILMGFLLFLPSLMAERERRLESGVVRVLDATPDSVGMLVVNSLRGGLQGDTSGAQYRTYTPESRAAEEAQAAQDVLAGEIVGFIELEPASIERGRLKYVGRNTTSIVTMQRLERVVNRAVLRRQLERAGLDVDRSEALATQQLRVETERISTRGRGGSGALSILFAIMVAVTLYLTIFIHGSNVMRGVLEEKQTRVAEVVLSSVPSDTLLFGKVIGIGAVGLTQLTAWVVIATGMMYVRAPILAKFGVQSAAAFSLPDLTPTMGIVVLLTFLLGFLFYAALFAIVGAIVTTEQEAQQAQLPVVLLLGLTLSTVQGILTNPDGAMARLLTIVPFSSPIVLPLRLSLAPIDDGELLASLVTLALSSMVGMFIAARLYRVGILMYGKRPTIREALRWLRAR